MKIEDLARNMIRLSGYEPDVDIMIKYTGLRPGEKLYEELLMNEEGMQTTENDRILWAGRLNSTRRPLSRACMSWSRPPTRNPGRSGRSYIELFPNTNTANKEERPWTQEET